MRMPPAGNRTLANADWRNAKAKAARKQKQLHAGEPQAQDAG
jgi:hypothetical protein